jgi:hypothetical protein
MKEALILQQHSHTVPILRFRFHFLCLSFLFETHKPMLPCLELKYSVLPPVSSPWLILAAGLRKAFHICQEDQECRQEYQRHISRDIAATGALLHQLGK